MSTAPLAPGRPRRSLIRGLGWIAVGTLIGAAIFAPGALASNDGNNGTVKIHEGATETEPIVHNEPHVCTFHLHFFFADPFQAGTWEIQQWSPGDKGTVVLSGTYDTNGDGEDRQPEEGVYTLPDGHYKLFWDGDQDTLKHDKMKVFWVDCPSETQTPPPGASESPTATPTFESSVGAETDSPTGTPELGTEMPTGTPELGTESPTGTPVAGSTETPGPTFEQSVAGFTSAPGTNNGGGAGGGVGNVTLPPTDAVGPVTGGPQSNGFRLLLLALAGLLGALLVMTPSRAGARLR